MPDNSKIDIVLPWVDHSDSEWQDSYKRYAGASAPGDKRPIRFRDWDLLRYWFRSAERFMPWVNRVHFVTWGHKPEWLNTESPKLNWVRHSDFIPGKYLPTFSANAIELNIHRIPSLSGHFIYFNDDIFVLKSLPAKRFFRDNLPCDCAIMTAKPSGGGIIHMAINDLDVLDAHFDKHSQMMKYPSKWFNPKYGRGLINNILLCPWKEFSGFVDPHMPNSFLKSTFDEVWQKASDILDATCSMKFRTDNDVNQWLMRYWQLAQGSFAPYNTRRRGLTLDITDDNLPDIAACIANQSRDIICINDSDRIEDFGKTKVLLQKSFEKILPDKSSFEI